MKEDITTDYFLDVRYPRKKDDRYPVRLRVTINRKSRFYGLGYYFTKEEFKAVTDRRAKGDDFEAQCELNSEKERAIKLIKAMQRPTFNQFKRLFTSKGTGGNVEQYFLTYIKECKRDDRHGTASSYECALSSLKKLKDIDKCEFKDITPDWLKDYRRKMEKKGASISTIGVYLRPLRFLFNRAIRDGVTLTEYYPFGNKKDGKFQIPSSQGRKRPLRTSEIQALVDYTGNLTREKYRDFFMLSFYLYGLNFFDLLTLKWSQVEDEKRISVIRKKTRETTGESKGPTILPLNNEARRCIKKYGSGRIYVFDVISEKDPPSEIRRKVQYFTRNANQALKAIAKQLNENTEGVILNPNISTVYARHSAASHAVKNKVSLPQISKNMIHSSIVMTSKYIDSLEDEDFHAAEVLEFKKTPVSIVKPVTTKAINR
jgi:integrase/recombinase XerD